MPLKSLSLLISMVFSLSLFAQEENDPSSLPNAFLVNVSYAFQMPGNDLKKDFGVNSDIGIGLDYLYRKFIFGLEADFIFGANAKKDVLASLRTEEGGIIGSSGELAPTNIGQRGMYIGALAGFIIPISKNNLRSGLRFTLGTGFLQHRFKIVDITEAIPQITGEYKKGYDHLTNGWGLKQFLGYQYFSNNKRINFYAGLEAVQAFTQNRRSINFGTMLKDETKRFDSLLGIRLGWSLPLYQDNGEEIFY